MFITEFDSWPSTALSSTHDFVMNVNTAYDIVAAIAFASYTSLSAESQTFHFFSGNTWIQTQVCSNPTYVSRWTSVNGAG